MSTLLEDTIADIASCVERALKEDIGTGDITAMLIPEQQQAKGEVLCREHAVICGCAWVDEVFKQLDPKTSITGWYKMVMRLYQIKHSLPSAVAPEFC